MKVQSSGLVNGASFCVHVGVSWRVSERKWERDKSEREENEKGESEKEWKTAWES